MREHIMIEEARPLDKGMGVAVGRRTVFRSGDNEDMARVARRVAYGNMLLGPTFDDEEFQSLANHIARGGLITSGRHLQHGDMSQPERNQEVFTNCATAATSFSKFYLLLNGSGVGRSYDDELMVVDWAYAPQLEVVLTEDHPDFPKTREDWFQFGKDFELFGFDTTYESFTDTMEAGVRAWFDMNIRTAPSPGAIVHRVADSREGWAKGLEIYESMTYARQTDQLLALVFDDVRRKGSPIAGMQDRPASGPLSVMRAFINVRNKVVLKAQNPEVFSDGDLMLMPWYQNMHVDHFFSVEVQVGGARRAARMSTKSYLDPDIMAFIRIKSENGLWTSNNSVMVDNNFWRHVRNARRLLAEDLPIHNPDTSWCYEVFMEVLTNSWKNGEPGFITGTSLASMKNGNAWRGVTAGFGSKKYQATHAGPMMKAVKEQALQARFPMIVNPCGEVELHVLGGYCVIGDVAPINEAPVDVTETRAWMLTEEEKQLWDERVEEAVRLDVRFLMRVNQMDSLYADEVSRTQRIGVSLTGIHEWAWARCGFSFDDLIIEKISLEFWKLVERMSNAAKDEARKYANELGVEIPHTVVTVKPAGTTSKLYGLSEGAHLPAMRQYVRWVQFTGQKDFAGNWIKGTDPVLIRYEELGYPVRQLRTFPGMSIVGFPTVPMICRLGLGDLLVTAPEAPPKDQYQYLRLLEKYWLGDESGNQISYTLKVYTDQHDFDEYVDIVADNQSTVRCCTIMPTVPDSQLGYEYLPEEEKSLEEFREIMEGIRDHEVQQDIDINSLLCASGACPI